MEIRLHRAVEIKNLRMLPKAHKSSQRDDFIRDGTYLLPGEDVLVEVKLDLFVGYVDAELLERVSFKVLKAKDVQDTDVKTLLFISGKELIDRITRLSQILKCFVIQKLLDRGS